MKKKNLSNRRDFVKTIAVASAATAVSPFFAAENMPEIQSTVGDSPKTDKNILFKANAEWKVVDMSDVQVKKGSALDLSSISEPGPAGKHGRVIVSESGNLAFEDSPDVPRRFNGYNGFFTTLSVLDDPDKNVVQQNFVKLAELIKRQGYDLVRPLKLESYIMNDTGADCEFNLKKLDNADRLIAELKANGIYIYLDIAAYRFGRVDSKKSFDERDDDKCKMFLGDPETRFRWKTIAEKMLTHVNPYTRVAWKDEPAIVCVNFYNEQEIFKFREFSKLLQHTHTLLNDSWRAWLRKKYLTAGMLASAWANPGLSDAQSFDKLEFPESLNKSTPEANDCSLFFRDLEQAEIAWCESVVRNAGYTGLTSQLDMTGPLLDSSVRWETSSVVCSHSFFAHPTNMGQIPTTITQASSVGKMADYWRSSNSTRFHDRPFLETEHHHFFWNQYQHEAGLVFAAYSALQGFDGLCIHEDPVALNVTKVQGMDWIASNPVARANAFITALLFKRSDVKQAVHRVELQVPSVYLKVSNNGNHAVNTEQNKIGLMTGFTLSFPDLTRPMNLKSEVTKPELVILPDSGAKIAGGDWNISVEDSEKEKFSLQKFISDLKAKEILPASNLSDPDSGVFESETGEITMRSKENLIKIVTPKTEGVSLEANKSEPLACLYVESSSIPAAVVVASLDAKPLDTSAHFILIYNTEMAFSGMELSEDRTNKFQHGTFPVLMRTGKLEATLRCKGAPKTAMYSLRIDGTRMEKLPVSVEGGKLKIKIDTATLKEGTTPFFELVVE